MTQDAPTKKRGLAMWQKQLFYLSKKKGQPWLYDSLEKFPRCISNLASGFGPLFQRNPLHEDDGPRFYAMIQWRATMAKPGTNLDPPKRTAYVQYSTILNHTSLSLTIRNIPFLACPWFHCQWKMDEMQRSLVGSNSWCSPSEMFRFW